MNNIRKIIVLFISILIISDLGYSQSSEGQFVDYKLILNEDGNHLDTLLLNRKYGDYWLGVLSGVNGNIDMGNLELLRKPYEPYDSVYNKSFIQYFTDYSAGYFVGLNGEWVPKSSMWAAGIRVYIFDTWTSNAQSDRYQDQIVTRYENETKFQYLTFSPYARYNFMSNLNFFIGLDIGISLNNTSLLIRNHTKGGEIKHDYLEFELSDINTRFGGHIGTSYEFEIADINQRMRLKAAPFFSLQAGTDLVSDNNSNWNVVNFKLGVTFKLSYDEIEFDTLKYKPVKEPPIILASLDRTSSLSLPEVNMESFAVSSAVSAIEGGLVEERLDFQPVLNLTITSKPEIIKAVEEKVDIVLAGSKEPRYKLEEKIELPKLITMKNEAFAFATSSSTELSTELKRYLDNVALYLKSHPGATLGITGHSDNQGTFTQNDRRAKERAEKVKSYLISKGIRSSRLLAGGKGSIEPIASNKTEAGRKRNRRVEIKIVPAPPKRR